MVAPSRAARVPSIARYVAKNAQEKRVQITNDESEREIFALLGALISVRGATNLIR